MEGNKARLGLEFVALNTKANGGATKAPLNVGSGEIFERFWTVSGVEGHAELSKQPAYGRITKYRGLEAGLSLSGKG